MGSNETENLQGNRDEVDDDDDCDKSWEEEADDRLTDRL